MCLLCVGGLALGWLLSDTAAAAAAPPATEGECWQVLNELAAASVFADLPDETMDTVYTLLDDLQEHCAEKRLDDAGRVVASIGELIGK